MSITDQSRWAFVALATPLAPHETGGLDPDIGRMAALAREALAVGCNGIVPFGTTGEGPCFSVAQRCAAVDGLVAGGVAAERIIVGIGATALADMVALARHATALGCPVLAPPPFYMRAGGPDGIVAAFDRLIAQVDAPGLRVLLYNIPQVTGFPFPVPAMRRLAERYPDIVVGVKDSGPVWADVEPAVRERGPLRVAVGAEEFIPRAMALGACGTICGLSNVAPATVVRAVEGNREAAEGLARLSAAFGDRPFLPTLKALLAGLRADDAWRYPTPPVEPMETLQVADLVEQVRALEA